MILKLAALGAIGYAGYSYFTKAKGNASSRRSIYRNTNGFEPDLSDPQVALAGGPLSTEAALRHAGQPLLQA